MTFIISRGTSQMIILRGLLHSKTQKVIVCLATGLMLASCHGTIYRKPMQPDGFLEVDPRSVNRPEMAGDESAPVSAFGSQVSAFQSALAASRSKPADDIPARDFSEHGIVLVNMLCYRYFREATEARQQARYREGLTTNVSTVIGALLNLDGASNYATGAVTAIAGGLSNDYKSQDASFLPAPDLSAVQKLVAKAMDAQADEMRALKQPTYSQISVRLIRIAETCDFSGIRALVQQSATEGAKNIKTDGSGNAMVSNATLPETKFERAKALQNSGFQHLKKCQWKEAETAFRDADAAYPQFQASYEFWDALRSNPDAKKKKTAMLALPLQKGGAYLPDDVKVVLSTGKCNP